MHVANISNYMIIIMFQYYQLHGNVGGADVLLWFAAKERTTGEKCMVLGSKMIPKWEL